MMWTFTTVSYDPITDLTALSDSTQSVPLSSLIGTLMCREFAGPRICGVVVDNDADTLYIRSDWTSGLVTGTVARIYDLRLTAGSPAIDTADDGVAPTLDIMGQGRVDIPGVGSSTADMGAIEYQP